VFLISFCPAEAVKWITCLSLAEASRGKVKFLLQSNKTWVGTQVVEFGLYLQKHQAIGSVGESLL
jgi:hypothetical protein